VLLPALKQRLIVLILFLAPLLYNGKPGECKFAVAREPGIHKHLSEKKNKAKTISSASISKRKLRNKGTKVVLLMVPPNSLRGNVFWSRCFLTLQGNLFTSTEFTSCNRGPPANVHS
jgi:hypothetical protein